MYKKIKNFLLFILGYIILRYIIQIFYTHFTRQIEGNRGRPYQINNNSRFSNTGSNISYNEYTTYGYNKYNDYCYNNSTLCSKT